MENAQLIAVLASIILQASPLIIAVCGEILTERSGVVNLSLDGTMLMAAMTAFVVGLKTDNIWLGFAAAAVIGAIFAAIVALGSIRLGQSQVAVGFVLALLGDDLSAFLGQNYTRMRGVSVPHYGIPVLKDIPVVGPILFDHDVVVYFAMALIVVTWWWLNRTQPGLKLRGSGERPTAAFARGVDVNRLRYLYTILGGALVGIAGAAFSLDVKIGWSDGHIRGTGWIALAIVIFGGWSPIRGAFGALLFGATKALATVLQRAFPEVSVVAFNSIPWILMILVLLAVGSDYTERFINAMPRGWQRPLRRVLRVSPPMALGTPFHEG
ncbi:MAG: ABC transporter permease [Anaerolineae bacterium]|uniref:ABC transporter permease n=1 Tax=Promineifilum sp. TaxID=2664178 RepID=UPI001D705D63|nr:ABC transporter permease [Anaerolineales bacterium]MCB8936630.1 ABC transporter permease [Promineifilum sp.]MCO5178786.1 ABC transporter permease [Promineifilum sp.]MCW5846868.1 ABC transporter permease [Anaerolineae bacterium]